MNNIKMLGIDLDGTLLNKEKTVSEKNKQAILACINNGIEVYLISGRPYCFTKYIANLISDKVKTIAANGGTYEIGNRCIEQPIIKDSIDAIVEALKQTNAHAFFKGKHEFFTHEPYDKQFLYDHMNPVFSMDNQVLSKVELNWDTLKAEAHDIVKILVYDRDIDALKQLRKQIECIKNIEITDYQAISFDLTANKVNKGNAIKEVLKENGWNKMNFMAIGDANNDLPMFREASLKVAMQNASQEIKEYCDVVTTACEEDGVAKAIEDYILISK
ncbi:MAG: HAD family hydrolase [Longicatena sp.]